LIRWQFKHSSAQRSLCDSWEASSFPGPDSSSSAKLLSHVSICTDSASPKRAGCQIPAVFSRTTTAGMPQCTHVLSGNILELQLGHSTRSSRTNLLQDVSGCDSRSGQAVPRQIEPPPSPLKKK